VSRRRAAEPTRRTDGREERMPVRRLVLDVDKAVKRPGLLELAAAIEAVEGVDGVNLTVTEIDIETVGMEVTVEGEAIAVDELLHAVEQTGAVVHSIDAVAAGSRLVERVPRER
jgi:hypothetical protein